jgi:aminomethyltransferase
MLLRTPLYDWHRARQARMVDFGGWEMPVQYTNIADEHTAVRTRAGLFDISHMGRLVFEGPDALPFVQHLITNNAASMKPGQVRYALVCNEKGGVRDDVLVYRLDPIWLMVVNASNREKILGWLEQQQGQRDVTVTDRTKDWGMIAVQGPRAMDLADVWTREPGAAPGTGWAGKLKYYSAVRQPLTPNPSPSETPIFSRTGYTGEDGFEIIVPAAALSGLCDAFTTLAGSGQAGEPFTLTPCGLGARDTLRLEAGMPLYGHELGEDIDPFQAGLGWAVKLDKGDFVGRQALTELQKDTTRPVRVGLELAGRRSAREGASVLRDGQVVGRVTSGTLTPTLNKAVAMAYVDRAHAGVGTRCEVDIRGKAEPAEVVALPFYRRPRS